MAVEVAHLQAPALEPKSPAPRLFISTPLKDLTFYFFSVSVVLIAWFAA
ncbi:MAG: hypothetical protein JNK82_08335, partial [Myxococcaceae bacterium]|nr:hypothetical protein [Myxococcaceae bacterium]